jgi:hypothetical protein
MQEAIFIHTFKKLYFVYKFVRKKYFYFELSEILIYKYIYKFVYEVHVTICQILTKNEFVFASCAKVFKYQICLKFVQWEPSCSMLMDGWTGRHYKTFSHFRKSAKS